MSLNGGGEGRGDDDGGGGGSLLGGLIGRRRAGGGGGGGGGGAPRRGLLLVSLGEIANGDELLLNYRCVLAVATAVARSALAFFDWFLPPLSVSSISSRRFRVCVFRLSLTGVSVMWCSVRALSLITRHSRRRGAAAQVEPILANASVVHRSAA